MPLVISEDDIDFERVRRAYQCHSFAPEQRAREDQSDYLQDIQILYTQMQQLTESVEQQAILDAEIERYKQGYLKHFYAVMDTKSRSASAMIVGPANFNVARNRKRLAVEDKRTNEFLEWREKAQAAIRKVILAARSDSQVRADEWQRLKERIERALDYIERIDYKLEPYDRTGFVSSIAGYVNWHANQGDVQMVEQAFALIREYNASHTKPAISIRSHTFWKLREKAMLKQAEQQKQAEVVAAEPESTKTVIGTYGDVQVVDNAEADRIQIIFPGKPDEATYRALKSAGWNWSPTNKAWQRKRTTNTRWSAETICSQIGKA